MLTYTLTHLSDHQLLHDLATLVAKDRVTTAALLAHIAEVDTRRLYAPAGYPSMYAYCVGELNLSEQEAFRRIHVARTAHRFPVLFSALADGRLHLSAAGLLAPHLTQDNVMELLATAAHRSKAEVDAMLAERYPRTALPPWTESPATQASPSPPVGQHAAKGDGSPSPQLCPGRVGVAISGARVTPLARDRFALQVSIDQTTHGKLQYARALLGHSVPSGDLARVLDRALDALIAILEKRKFAAASRPRPHVRRSSSNPRHVPAHVRRAVWERDQGQCTFVGETGRRCPARARLEFDHVHPVACGGQASVENLRLRCRPHNQFEAERAFGSDFMNRKRRMSRRAVMDSWATQPPVEHTVAPDHQRRAEGATAAIDQARDVMACLRGLGFRVGEVHRAMTSCANASNRTLEEQVRATLRFLCPQAAVHGRRAHARAVAPARTPHASPPAPPGA